MATYNYECSSCSDIKTLNLSISEFVRTKDSLLTSTCEKCGEKKFSRIFEPLSSKVKRDRDEIAADAKEESRKLAEKVRMGDQKAIRDIYGDN